MLAIQRQYPATSDAVGGGYRESWSGAIADSQASRGTKTENKKKEEIVTRQLQGSTAIRKRDSLLSKKIHKWDKDREEEEGGGGGGIELFHQNYARQSSSVLTNLVDRHYFARIVPELFGPNEPRILL